jgi:hypothetical protein
MEDDFIFREYLNERELRKDGLDKPEFGLMYELV